MSIYATDSGIVREPIPAGMYIARCYQMIHLGTVHGNFGPKNMVRIGWELPEELKVFDEAKGPQPLVVSQEYPLSMNAKANLRKMLESWRGKGFTEIEAKKFDVTKLLGVPCMINIIHAPGKTDPTKIYANIASVSAVPKTAKPPKQINPTINLSYDSWDQDVFDNLPEFIRNKMVVTPEYAQMKNPSRVVEHEMNTADDSDLPF